MSKEVGLRIALVTMGVVLGSAGAFGAASWMLTPGRGTTFDSVDDLRRAMLAGPEKPSNSSVDLRDILNPHTDDRIIYDLRPNLDVPFQGVPVRTNSCGMRGPERPHAKPPDTYRIALLGDSFVFGWGVEQSKIFAQRLEDLLNERARGKRAFEVLNFGVPGYSTFQEVALFKERALDFNLDAVLLYFIENDFGMPFFVRDIENPAEILSGVTFARMSWRKNDERVAAQAKKLAGFGPSPALNELAALARDRGIEIFLAINPRSRWRQDLRRLWAVNEKNRITLIPMLDELLLDIRVRQINEKDLGLPHDPHPSALKHDILAHILAPNFFEALPQ